MEQNEERALLAGGCFWGMQDLFWKQQGVLGTRVGYTGGDLEDPTYHDVKTGKTGHAEAIEILFDPDVISYREILEFFFQIHDPTTANRQGNDIGSQYRSTVFFMDDDQRDIAQSVISDIDRAGVLPKKIVTEVTKATVFYEAEDVHQDYLVKNPRGYTCHFVREEWRLPSNHRKMARF